MGQRKLPTHSPAQALSYISPSSMRRPRAEALRNAGALLTFNTSKKLRSGEAELLDGAWHVLRHGLHGLEAPMHKERIEDWLQALTARRCNGLLFRRRVQRRNLPSNRSQPFSVKFAGIRRRN